MNNNILNILRNINISSIASTTNKTLGIIRKSIPIYKEIRPYMNKEKTIFKNEIKKESETLSSDLKNDNLTFFQ